MAVGFGSFRKTHGEPLTKSVGSMLRPNVQQKPRPEVTYLGPFSFQVPYINHMETKPIVTPEVPTATSVKHTSDKLRHKLVETSAKAPQFVQTYLCKCCQGKGHVVVVTAKETVFRCSQCSRTWIFPEVLSL